VSEVILIRLDPIRKRILFYWVANRRRSRGRAEASMQNTTITLMDTANRTPTITRVQIIGEADPMFAPISLEI